MIHKSMKDISTRMMKAIISKKEPMNISPNILLVIATILWGIWGIADKFAITKSNPYVVQWMYSIPYILVFPIWFFLSKKFSTAADVNTPAFIWSIVACLSSMAAMFLFFIALQSTSTSVAVAFTSAYPIVTLAFGVMTNTESFSIQKILGLFAIIVGVVILQAK